jgi:hypothetical protein
MSKFDVSQQTNLTLDKKTRRYMYKKRLSLFCGFGE